MTTLEQFVTASPAPLARFEPTEAPYVSFIVVTYGTGGIVVDTLASLAVTTAATPYEVIIVDNPHPRLPDRVVPQLLLATANVRVLRPGDNLGFGGGCNMGASHARGDVLAFVNPDLSFPAGWLDRLLEILDGADPPSIIAPVLVDPDGSIQEAGQTIDRAGVAWANVTEPGEQVVEVEYASAACWLIRRNEFERIGGFDPAFFPAYYEDVDFAFRARKLGGRTSVHGGVRVVHHRGSGTPDESPSLTRQHAALMAAWPEIATAQPAAEELAAAGWRSSQS